MNIVPARLRECFVMEGRHHLLFHSSCDISSFSNESSKISAVGYTTYTLNLDPRNKAFRAPLRHN